MVEEALALQADWVWYLNLAGSSQQTPDIDEHLASLDLRPAQAGLCKSLYIKNTTALDQHTLESMLRDIQQDSQLTEVREISLEINVENISEEILNLPEIVSRIVVAPRADTPDLRAQLHHLAQSGRSLCADVQLSAHSSAAQLTKLLTMLMALGFDHITLVETEDDENLQDLLTLGNDFLERHNYHRHELFGYSRTPQQSVHWSHVLAGGNVLGMGPDAQSRWFIDRKYHVTDANDPSGWRKLTPHESLQEAAMLGLRRIIGINPSTLCDMFELTIRDAFDEHALQLFAADGFVCRNGDTLALTSQGIPYYDSILAKILR